MSAPRLVQLMDPLEDPSRRCIACDQSKTPQEFRRLSRRTDLRSRTCRECERTARRAHHEQTKQQRCKFFSTGDIVQLLQRTPNARIESIGEVVEVTPTRIRVAARLKKKKQLVTRLYPPRRLMLIRKGGLFNDATA